MEKRKAKAACTCAGRESHSGFYCDLEIGYSASVRRARYSSSARQTESHKSRGSDKGREESDC